MVWPPPGGSTFKCEEKYIKCCNESTEKVTFTKQNSKAEEGDFKDTIYEGYRNKS